MKLIFDLLNVIVPCFLLLIAITVRGVIDSDKMYHLKWWERPFKAIKSMGVLIGATFLLLCFYHTNSDWIHNFLTNSVSYKKSPQTMLMLPVVTLLLFVSGAMVINVFRILFQKSETVRPFRLKGVLIKV